MELRLVFAFIIAAYWASYRIPVIVKKKLQDHLVEKKRLKIIGELPLVISLVFYINLTYSLLNLTHALSSLRCLAAIGTFCLSATFNEWARTTLGKQWSGATRILKDHRLIRKGPYSLARHPMYFANLLMMISGLIIFQKWSLVSLFITNFGILVYRIKIEEEELENKFGQSFKAYQKKVKKIIPFFY